MLQVEDEMANLDVSKLRARAGRAFPLGPAVRPGGVRFAVVSRHATRVWVALFEHVGDKTPAVEFEFDRDRHRIGDVWSIYIEGAPPNVAYMYRMDGPFDPVQGHRYRPDVYLLDPYARLIVGNVQDATAKCIAADQSMDQFDDVFPRHPVSDLVIYETHVKGFTHHESSGVTHRGTYKGLIEKIPHLQELGITAVELLPIQEFGEDRMGRCSLTTRDELRNYWGYNTIGFFAPAMRYASEGGRGEQLREFRELVAALHKAGIEVILDVVFNHTSEGNEQGPTMCFRGIDNAVYYMLNEQGYYLNFSGCGNTMNCNHPIVRDFIIECLHYWVTVMHVDGFRFDLASILGRDIRGNITTNAGLIERIAEDPALRDTKLIAEAWDAGGAYQVGSFGDMRWAEWNGHYRDDVRLFWRGERAMRGVFASRLTGSSDVYREHKRSPMHSINFLTAHDGMTLRDLVSYNHKHNFANGENNRDGAPDDFSWNCGVEGETDNAAINALRLRMQKNFIATLFLSLGIPMVLGGDEFGRTQKGNNNAYCQDNEISWYDWSLLEKNQELFRFFKEMIRFRNENVVFKRDTHFTGQPVQPGGQPDCAWFTKEGAPMNWAEHGMTLACRIDGAVNNATTLYLMFNPARSARQFRIPQGDWHVRINTAEQAPDDIRDASEAPLVHGGTWVQLEKTSMAVLSMRDSIGAGS